MRLALAAATTLILAATLASPAALAGTQQERMTKCNADAKAQNLAGEPRKAFMKTCLSGKAPGAAPATQQDKMKSCNKTAGDKALKGDERKAFMSDCLKG